MCLIRHFELQVAQAYEQQMTPGPVYLSVGQEAPAATLSMLTRGYAVFTQHRGHSAYLAYGGDPAALRDELLGLESGCCQGRGGSPCVQDLNIPMYGHHGLIGENIPLATGHALAAQRPTVVYFGDAAAEEDYALASFGFAATHRLPILYVCEDNDLSILTPTEDRRHWQVQDVAQSMGLAVASIVDDPRIIHETVSGLLNELPAFVNIKTCRHLWHAGVGTDGPPRWDRLDEYRDICLDAQRIEDQVKAYTDELWQEQLQKVQPN
jgi:pyruvate dehydrogenase E1 component alpha subunit